MSVDFAKAIARHFQDWLDRHKQAERLVPIVQHSREFAEWQQRAYDDIVSDLSKEERQTLDQRLELAYHNLTVSLPLPLPFEPVQGNTTSSAVAASTMTTYGFALSIRDFGETPNWKAQPHIVAFQTLESVQHRQSEVRGYLMRMLPQVVAQFDRTLAERRKAAADPERDPQAALEIRTLLDSLQGNLFELARRAPREPMTWEKMVDRLARPDSREASRELLLEQGVERGKLIDRLSARLKRRPNAGTGIVADLWPLALAHLFIVCANVTEP